MVRTKKVSTIGYAPEGRLLPKELEGVSEPSEYCPWFMWRISFLLRKLHASRPNIEGRI